MKFFAVFSCRCSDAEGHQKMEGPFACEWDELLSEGLELQYLSQSAPPRPSPEFEELGGVGELPRLGANARGGGTRPNRLRATGFFLTYSQSELPRDDICRRFRSESRMKRVIVGQEHHQDGGQHWHVLVEYEAQKEVRTAYFDISGEHPNIKVWIRAEGSTYEQWFLNHWKYCKKEDPTPYIVGEEPKARDSRKRKRNEAFSEAMDMARNESVHAAMQFLEQNCPYDLVTKYDQIHRTLVAVRNSHHGTQDPARSVEDFPLAPTIPETWHCLYINGPTGTGKTAWARSLLPEAVVVRHRDQLRDCDFSKGVIFDDFDVGHWPPTAVIHLLDWEEPSGIDIKHSHVVIPAKTQKIFTHNCAFDRWVSKDATEEQVAACRRRVNVVNIHVKLY